MANTNSPPNLYDKVDLKYPIHRAFDITILVLLISLLVYRLLYISNHGFAWLLALLCETCFTFTWFVTVSSKWNPVEYKTYPERLSQKTQELPPVDIFVTTADPVLEPPILTVNTVISLLAVDYPADKLACYVSDDGSSPITYYSLVEASKFAKHWAPFCKKHNIQARAPFRYFSSEVPLNNSSEFQQEYNKMKDEYEELASKINDADKKSIERNLSGDFAAFSNIERKNHPTIIKVVWENKAGISDELPHLIYISREKRPQHPHHYKAGAMNVLTRVSGMMTNAPFMLNLDCDMFVNNPKIVCHAMCLLLGSRNERESGFVQCPQYFYDGLKDDPFGNQFEVLHKYIGSGIVGIQGPFYGGTGCFHRRKVIYGSCPRDVGIPAESLTPVHGGLTEKEQLRVFGNSKEFVRSAAHALQGKANTSPEILPKLIEAAHQVAGCGYEYGTSWGKEVGWQYGPATEDILTGLKIHARGWRSVLCSPDPRAFLGCAPRVGPISMTQQKRWATGLLEILISERNPIIATLTARLQFRQCLAYLWILIWGLRSIPEICYAVLPAYCIITNSSFLPKFHEPAMYIHVALFLSYVIYSLLEYLETGLSIRAWWNNQRMARMNATNAWLFGVISVFLKILRISGTVFEVTQKDQSSSNVGDEGRFTFDASPIFVPGTTILLLQLTAFVMGFGGMQLPSVDDASGLGEILCSVLVVMCFWPFVKGLFGKGKYGIPLSTVCKSSLLSLSFVYLVTRTSRGQPE
ncbi:PREDICTED: cellulose synthase-like protein H1 [Populus euphratica]|uniref:Cellulose synthase-like protein H1 n=1 Tax=Populus euphratica TaxID=75702 RepID=A0AAJ6T9E2_POPEU|nr:PREDICTED: cellulose synthase-like protein H1 [Populus euphratica]